MSLYDDFFSEAIRAYRAQQMRDAALLYKRAKEAAEETNDHVAAWQAGVWEAICLQFAGELRRAYATLFLLVSEIPEGASSYTRWLAEIHSYELWYSLGDRPRAEHLKRLERLYEYSTSDPNVPQHDVHVLWAGYYEDLGDWSQVLRCYEDAWSSYSKNGYFKCDIAAGAVMAALQLGQLSEAQRWFTLLSESNQDRAAGRKAYQVCRGFIALYTYPDSNDLEVIGQELEDEIRIQQHVNGAAVQLLVRFWLLLRFNDDPEDRFHPARSLLRDRSAIRRGWTRRRLATDYRLASLRFSLRIPPCEDYFYRQAQEISSLHPIDGADIQYRIQRALHAVRLFEQEADKLDILTECQWYSAQANRRRERFEALLAASLPVLR